MLFVYSLWLLSCWPLTYNVCMSIFHIALITISTLYTNCHLVRLNLTLLEASTGMYTPRSSLFLQQVLCSANDGELAFVPITVGSFTDRNEHDSQSETSSSVIQFAVWIKYACAKGKKNSFNTGAVKLCDSRTSSYKSTVKMDARALWTRV